MMENYNLYIRKLEGKWVLILRVRVGDFNRHVAIGRANTFDYVPDVAARMWNMRPR